MKLNVLQSYVNDLGDQNQVLIQTVEDLEKEANEKVASLEVKLRTSDDIINVSMFLFLSPFKKIKYKINSPFCCRAYESHWPSGE